jgi:hypothetical protein
MLSGNLILLTMIKKLLFYSLIIIAFLIAVFFLFPKNVVEIKSIDDNKTLAIKEYSDGDMLEFSYIHSVSKTPITEFLEIIPDGFMLRKVIYEDQGGAGMPEYASGNQEFYVDEDGKFVIDGFTRHFDSIDINVQEKYNDKIRINEKTIDLYSICEKDCSISILQSIKINLMVIIYKNK